MKKIVLVMIMAVLLAGCYDEFRLDYPYTTVAFSGVTGNSSTAGVLGRTVVKDEGLKVDIGVYLAGVLENKEERWVRFEIDPSILTGTPYELMPADYYTLSNSNTFTIPKGSYIGRITVTLDSAKFVGDPKSLEKIYAIPFRLTETSVDSILEPQSTKIFQLSYINHYEGWYDQVATFQTFDETGGVINAGNVSNVISATTVALDTVLADGMLYIGSDYEVMYNVNPDKTVWMKKLPVSDPVPVNLAMTASSVTTSYVSPWENLLAIRNGIDPTSSRDKTGGAYGNWNSANTWRWVQYEWTNLHLISRSDIYWWTDGGGILIPTDSYIEYWDLTLQDWVEVPNNSGYPNAIDMYNITTFDEVLTDKIRVWMINTSQSCGILEWKVWGNMAAVTPEQSKISEVLPQGTCSFDQAASVYNLNYRINYEGETFYTIVDTKLTWRNRVRDGVNEWRR